MNKQDRKSAISKLRQELATKDYESYATFSDSFSFRKKVSTAGSTGDSLIPSGHRDVLVAQDRWITTVLWDETGKITSNISVELKDEADLEFVLAQL